MDPKITQPQRHASFWAALSPSARAFISRVGIEADHEPTASDGAPLAETTSERARQLEGKGNRATRRATAAIERELTHARPKPGKGQKRDAYVRQLARDHKYLEALRARMAGTLPDEPPPELRRLIPRRIWIMCREILADASGRAARIWFRRARNKVAIGLLRIAALVPGSEGTRYTWADWRARCIAALGLALLELAAPTIRKGAWSTVVRGVTRSALAALLANPWEPDRTPHVNTIAGTHRVGATLESGQVGYLRALELAGFCYPQQLPANQVQGFERWKVRKGDELETYASNRYWVITDAPTAPLDDDAKRRLIAAHHQGLIAHRDRPTRAPRRPSSSCELEATPPAQDEPDS